MKILYLTFLVVLSSCGTYEPSSSTSATDKSQRYVPINLSHRTDLRRFDKSWINYKKSRRYELRKDQLWEIDIASGKERIFVDQLVPITVSEQKARPIEGSKNRYVIYDRSSKYIRHIGMIDEVILKRSIEDLNGKRICEVSTDVVGKKLFVRFYDYNQQKGVTIILSQAENGKDQKGEG